MRNLALMWVLAACLLGCGGKDKDAKDKAASAVDTVATFTDTRDGKVYRIVKIGRQVWFAENLNYAADGSVCYDNKAENCAKYGRLYDWNTAMTACPAGTHLPTDEEWTTLVDYVGGSEFAGKKLKSTSGWYLENFVGGGSFKAWAKQYWQSYSNVPTGIDYYGFSALPGGAGYSSGEFKMIGYRGYWRSATEIDAWNVWFRRADEDETQRGAWDAWCRHMSYRGEAVGRYTPEKISLFSVRCVLDNEKEKRK